MSEIGNDYVETSTPPSAEDWDSEETHVTPSADEPSLSPESDSDFYGNRGHNLSRDQIQQLISKVDALNKSNEEDLLGMLQEALDLLSDEDEGNDGLAWEKYKDVAEEIGEEVDEWGSGATATPAVEPTRIAHGMNYYEMTDASQTLELTAQGSSKRNVVETAGKFILRPKDPKDTIKLSKDGHFLVIKLTHEGRTESYKVNLATVQKIHIASDAVTGNVQDDKLTVGAQNIQEYISSTKIQNWSDKLNSAPSKVGCSFFTFQVTPMTMNSPSAPVTLGPSTGQQTVENDFSELRPGEIYGFRSIGDGDKTRDKVEGVKALLPLMGAAVKEKDPQARKEKWNQIVETLSRWNSQEENKGHVNDRAQLLFNVIYGELGEEGFKEAMALGLIPAEFGTKLSELLLSEASENSKMKEINPHQIGGPGWTHQTSADFLKQHSKNNSLQSDEDYAFEQATTASA